MRHRLLLLALLAALPSAPALAGGPAFWVTDTAICDALRGGTGSEVAIGDLDILTLDATGYSGLEFRCTFEPRLDLNAPDGSTSTHVGYCEEPGFIAPQLFTFRIERRESPRVTLYDGADTPLVFFACP